MVFPEISEEIFLFVFATIYGTFDTFISL